MASVKHLCDTVNSPEAFQGAHRKAPKVVFKPELPLSFGMSSTSRESEVAEVDAFLAEQKSLGDPPPTWVEAAHSGRWTAKWPVRDALGVVREGAELRFTCDKSNRSKLSIAVLLGGKRIYGIDLVSGERKPNPPDAHRFGLPASVTESHLHAWEDNRQRALLVGPGELPYRRPTSPSLKRLPHALAALAQAINLTLTPEHASFDVPPQGYLFGSET